MTIHNIEAFQHSVAQKAGFYYNTYPRKFIWSTTSNSDTFMYHFGSLINGFLPFTHLEIET